MGWAIGIIIAIACGAAFVISRAGGQRPMGAFRNRPTNSDGGAPIVIDDDDVSVDSGDASDAGGDSGGGGDGGGGGGE